MQFDSKVLSGLICFLLTTTYCSFGQHEMRYTVSEIRDIDYLEERSVDTIQKLNLVIPEGINDYPLLIWIGGGAWSYVDRNVEMDLGERFAEEGIAVASIGHRLSAAVWRDSSLSKGVQHPEHIKDIASSVKWLYDNASEYGYSKEKIFIGGFSSGAHLAALIGLDFRYVVNEGLEKNVIKGMIPISGTYDIINYHDVFKNGDNPELARLHVESVFGDTEEDFINASPITYLNNLGTPMLLMSDNALGQYTRLFEEKLKETEFKKYEIIYINDLNHGELWRNISFEESSIYRKAMVKFIRSNT